VSFNRFKLLPFEESSEVSKRPEKGYVIKCLSLKQLYADLLVSGKKMGRVKSSKL
jgi:hypothetical protein